MHSRYQRMTCCTLGSTLCRFIYWSLIPSQYPTSLLSVSPHQIQTPSLSSQPLTGINCRGWSPVLTPQGVMDNAHFNIEILSKADWAMHTFIKISWLDLQILIDHSEWLEEIALCISQIISIIIWATSTLHTESWMPPITFSSSILQSPPPSPLVTLALLMQWGDKTKTAFYHRSTSLSLGRKQMTTGAL